MNNDSLDSVFRKYSIVWIWSILIGLNSGAIFAIARYHGESWGIYGLILAIPTLLSVWFNLISWMNLVRVFRKLICPLIFSGQPLDDVTVGSKDLEMRRLNAAFLCGVLSLVFMMLSSLLEFAVTISRQGFRSGGGY
jgi:hypothetical protein